MRNPQDPDPDRWLPLGSPIPKKPSPPAPDWSPVPGSPGIECDKDGHLRTALPLPALHLWSIVLQVERIKRR